MSALRRQPVRHVYPNATFGNEWFGIIFIPFVCVLALGILARFVCQCVRDGCLWVAEWAVMDADPWTMPCPEDPRNLLKG